MVENESKAARCRHDLPHNNEWLYDSIHHLELPVAFSGLEKKKLEKQNFKIKKNDRKRVWDGGERKQSVPAAARGRIQARKRPKWENPRQISENLENFGIYLPAAQIWAPNSF